jgi:hypothetical protein
MNVSLSHFQFNFALTHTSVTQSQFAMVRPDLAHCPDFPFRSWIDKEGSLCLRVESGDDNKLGASWDSKHVSIGMYACVSYLAKSVQGSLSCSSSSLHNLILSNACT